MEPQEGMYNLDWANLPVQRAQSSQPTSPTSSAMNGHLAKPCVTFVVQPSSYRKISEHQVNMWDKDGKSMLNGGF